MSRIDQAKKAYQEKDFSLVQLAHARSVIHRDIHTHRERHAGSFSLSDIILGGQDGIVNVLGIILGMAAATNNTQLVVVAGLAATFAESISMAAVAYTSRIAEADYYQSEYEREKWEIEHVPAGEREEIRALYENYGFRGKVLSEIVDRITSDKDIWLTVMMEQELKIKKIKRNDAVPSAMRVGISAVIGSLIPLFPYFFLPIQLAIVISIVISAGVLFGVGYYKAKTTIGRNLIRQGIEISVIGMVSAFAGYLIGVLFQARLTIP